MAQLEVSAQNGEKEAFLHRLACQEQLARAAGFEHTAQALARWRDRELRSLVGFKKEKGKALRKSSKASADPPDAETEHLTYKRSIKEEQVNQRNV